MSIYSIGNRLVVITVAEAAAVAVSVLVLVSMFVVCPYQLIFVLDEY